MIAGSSPFIGIAAADVGQWLRGVVGALLAGPGDLYNPVYIGPLPAGYPLRHVVGEAAAETGCSLHDGLDPPAAGVWMAGVEEAEAAIAAGVTPRPGVQWVVWSGAASTVLPDQLAGWLGATGIAVDPSVGGVDRSSGTSMSGIVAAVCSDPASRDRGFVAVVGEAHALGSLAAELQFHLELEAGEPVWRGAADRWAGEDGDRVTRVLILGAGSDLAELCSRLRRVPAGMLPWGLVMDTATAERLSMLSDWRPFAGRCVWVRRTAGGMRIDEDLFPAVSDLLVDSRTSERADGIAQFDLGAVSLVEILQAAEGWSRSGTLIVFGPDRAGFVRLGQGRISGAGFYGSMPTVREEAPRVVHEVLCALSTWRGVAGVFVPGEVAAGGVPIGRLVMALAHAREAERSAYVFPALQPYEVGELLLVWGLAEVARTFLRRAERASPWGPEEDVLLGSISAAHDPEAASARLRHGALRAFSERGADRGTALYVNGMLNALLVEVRGGHTVPAVAWSIVGGWLRDVGAGWVTTARHAAIWMELALRSGASDSALEAQARLRDLSGGEGRWEGLLSIRIDEAGDE